MVQHSPSLFVGQLVSVTQYYPSVNDAPQIGPALAVGHMTLPGNQVGGDGKGKAVNILHTWKDHLWEMGGKEDPPSPRVVELNQKSGPEVDAEDLPGGYPDPAIGATSERSGQGSPQAQDEPPPAMLLKEEHNPLSKQGISPSRAATNS